MLPSTVSCRIAVLCRHLGESAAGADLAVGQSLQRLEKKLPLLGEAGGLGRDDFSWQGGDILI